MKKIVLSCILCVLAGATCLAGVVVEMETSTGSEGETAVDTIYAQGNMLRMDPHEERGDETTMIFRGNELLMVDRAKNECQRIDEAGVREISGHLGGMMKQMEEQLAKMPPEQREMAEKMMKGRMPAGMGQKAPARRIEKGGTEQVGEYSCTVHTAYAGEEKVWEVCAAKRSAVGDFEEAAEAFQAMSEFTESLREMAMQGPMANMLQTPLSGMGAVDGVPVRMRGFANGRQISESTLKSVTKKALGDDWFSAPKGCKVTNLGDEIKRRR